MCCWRGRPAPWRIPMRCTSRSSGRWSRGHSSGFSTSRTLTFACGSSTAGKATAPCSFRGSWPSSRMKRLRQRICGPCCRMWKRCCSSSSTRRARIWGRRTWSSARSLRGWTRTSRSICGQSRRTIRPALSWSSSRQTAIFSAARTSAACSRSCGSRRARGSAMAWASSGRSSTSGQWPCRADSTCWCSRTTHRWSACWRSGGFSRTPAPPRARR
mmetsp:Transcript_26768/g.80685  ORF Transcript_26768/g.80685 Transcript_26768/m.80685 type:complete len:215 (-) Transcript_26768:1378-2022(-)